MTDYLPRLLTHGRQAPRSPAGKRGTMEDLFIQFLPTMLIQVVLAVVFFKLWRKLGRNPWLGTILMLVPLAGLFVSGVLHLRALFILADRLNALESRGADTPT